MPITLFAHKRYASLFVCACVRKHFKEAHILFIWLDRLEQKSPFSFQNVNAENSDRIRRAPQKFSYASVTNEHKKTIGIGNKKNSICAGKKACSFKQSHAQKQPGKKYIFVQCVWIQYIIIGSRIEDIRLGSTIFCLAPAEDTNNKRNNRTIQSIKVTFSMKQKHADKAGKKWGAQTKTP